MMTAPKNLTRPKSGQGCKSRANYYQNRVLREKGKLPPICGPDDTLDSCIKALGGP